MLANTLDGNLRTGVCLSSMFSKLFIANHLFTGWAKYMEWMYPVEVRFTSKSTFRAAGAVEAAATL